MATLEDQLTRLAERGPTVDPRFVVRHAIQIAATDSSGHDTLRAYPASARRAALSRSAGRSLPPRSRWFSVAAAALLLVVGAVGILALRSRDQAPGGQLVPATPSAEPVPSPAPVDPTSGSLLTTPVPSDVQPLITLPRVGWEISSTTGFQPVPPGPASVVCPGCGATRLVLAADDPLGGAIFTAWTIEGDYDLNQLASAVAVGTIEGRATSSAAGTPTEQNRMTVAWPLEPGRTAFVDSYGLSDQQVLDLAASLTFESTVPAMPARPPGFHRVDPPVAGSTAEIYLNLTSSPGEDNGGIEPFDYSVIELYATNAGLHGLVDWGRFMPLLLHPWESIDLDGATVAYKAPPPDERPILAVTASWIAGGWSYTAIGHAFGSEADFLDALSDLELTTPDGFAAATADAQTTPDFEGSVTATGWAPEAAGS